MDRKCEKLLQSLRNLEIESDFFLWSVELIYNLDDKHNHLLRANYHAC